MTSFGRASDGSEPFAATRGSVGLSAGAPNNPAITVSPTFLPVSALTALSARLRTKPTGPPKSVPPMMLGIAAMVSPVMAR